MKQSEKKQKPAKKTLSEVCADQIRTIHSIQREREEQALKAKHRQQEDEMMAIIHGPNWRTKELPGDMPPPHPKYAKVQNDDDSKYIPEAANSGVRLKAS